MEIRYGQLMRSENSQTQILELKENNFIKTVTTI